MLMISRIKHLPFFVQEDILFYFLKHEFIKNPCVITKYYHYFHKYQDSIRKMVNDNIDEIKKAIHYNFEFDMTYFFDFYDTFPETGDWDYLITWYCQELPVDIISRHFHRLEDESKRHVFRCHNQLTDAFMIKHAEYQQDWLGARNSYRNFSDDFICDYIELLDVNYLLQIKKLPFRVLERILAYISPSHLILINTNVAPLTLEFVHKYYYSGIIDPQLLQMYHPYLQLPHEFF